MEKKGDILLITLFLIILFSSLSMANTQTNVNTDKGLEINYPKFEEVVVNQPFNLTFEVYNISDGLKITNADCNLTIVNQTGHISPDYSLTLLGEKYNLPILKGNFTERGIYVFNIYCQNTIYGGLASGVFKINSLGTDLHTSESIFYIAILFSLLLLFSIFIYVSVKIPYDNVIEQTNEGLAVTKVTRSKYVKMIFMVLTYGLFLTFITVITGMANNYIVFSELRSLLTNYNLYFRIGGYIFNTVIAWFIFYNLWKDIILNKTILKYGKSIISGRGR